MTSIISKKARGRFRPLSLSAMLCAVIGLTAIKAFAFTEDIMPSYPGGETALMQDVAAALEYPAAAYEERIEGRVIVTFVIDTLGHVTRPKVMRGVRADVDSAAVNAIMKLKPFTPGMRGGRPLNVNYTVPVRFRINVPAEPAPAPQQQPEEQAADNKDADNEVMPDGSVKYKDCDTPPEYPGGEIALAKDIMRAIRYPARARNMEVQGRVVVDFVIDSLGNVTQPKILRSVSPELNTEAMRVVKHLRRFSPGIKNGVPVSVHYTLPINFRLPIEEYDTSGSLLFDND